jgi:hypothetical protein
MILSAKKLLFPSSDHKGDKIVDVDLQQANRDVHGSHFSLHF